MVDRKVMNRAKTTAVRNGIPSSTIKLPGNSKSLPECSRAFAKQQIQISPKEKSKSSRQNFEWSNKTNQPCNSSVNKHQEVMVHLIGKRNLKVLDFKVKSSQIKSSRKKRYNKSRVKKRLMVVNDKVDSVAPDAPSCSINGGGTLGENQLAQMHHKTEIRCMIQKIAAKMVEIDFPRKFSDNKYAALRELARNFFAEKICKVEDFLKAVWVNNWHGIKATVVKAQKSKEAAPKTAKEQSFNEKMWKFVGGKVFMLIKMRNFSFEKKLRINEEEAFRLLGKYLFYCDVDNSIEEEVIITWLKGLWYFNCEFMKEYKEEQLQQTKFSTDEESDSNCLRWFNVGGVQKLAREMLSVSFAAHYEADKVSALATTVNKLFGPEGIKESKEWIDRVWSSNERGLKDRYWNLYENGKNVMKENKRVVNGDGLESTLEIAGGIEGIAQEMAMFDFPWVYQMNEKVALKHLEQRVNSNDGNDDSYIRMLDNVWKSDTDQIQSKVANILAIITPVL